MTLPTVLIWLLISVGSGGDREARPTMVVERFATLEDCQAIAKVLNDSTTSYTRIHRCVQARVLRQAAL
jgi:hypothetical protein